MLRGLCLLLLVALPAQAQNFIALNLNQSQVVGGATVGGTVAISQPAPVGGVSVTLWSGDDVRVPSEVIIPVGAKFTGFSVATSPTSSPLCVRILASTDNARQQTFLQVMPAAQAPANPNTQTGLQMYKEDPDVGPVYGAGIPYYYPYPYGYNYPGPNPWAEPTHFDGDGYPMIRGEEDADEETLFVSALAVVSLWAPAQAQPTTMEAALKQPTEVRVLELQPVNGPLGPELGQMKNLEVLILKRAGLKSLPPEIGKLQKLKVLVLDNNELTGLPAEIGQLKNLRMISANNNQLASLPDLSGLAGLDTLAVRNNLLGALPAGLRSLHHLQASHNQISSLPAMPQLEDLDVGHNKLASFPTSVMQIVGLQSLVLSDNAIVSLPVGLSEMKDLNLIDCSNCQLIALPDDLGLVPNLEKLYLSGNAITQLPDTLANLLRLRLDLNDNSLANGVPVVFKITSLKGLDLGGNDLGSLPEALGDLTQLTYLNLNDNQLKAVPASLSQLRQLRTLRVERNKLTQLPLLKMLTELRSLQLDGNQLATLPDLKELRDLTTLSAEGNSLSHVPAGLSSLESLTQVCLRGNPIPAAEIEQLKQSGVTVGF